MAYIVPGKLPETCSECMFRSPYVELSVDVGTYKKVDYCLLAPEEIEDPWRDLLWTSDNKEKWCPLKEVEA